MKTLSNLVFSVFHILRQIRPATINQPLLKEHFMEMSEINWENILYPYVCTDSRSLVNVSPWE